MRKVNNTRNRVVSETKITAVIAMRDIITAKTSETDALDQVALSTKQYAKARSAESKNKFWFLMSAADTETKAARKSWDEAWGEVIAEYGGKKTDKGKALYTSRNVQYGRARAHSAAAMLATKHAMTPAQTREAKKIVSSYQDSKKTKEDKPFAERFEDKLKSLYRLIYNDGSNRQRDVDDLADITKMLKRHNINALDLQRDNQVAKPNKKKKK